MYVFYVKADMKRYKQLKTTAIFCIYAYYTPSQYILDIILIEKNMEAVSRCLYFFMSALTFPLIKLLLS